MSWGRSPLELKLKKREAATQRTFNREEIENVYGGTFVDGNSVELLWRGPETFQRIFDEIRSARELVCLEFFIFRDDETGSELAALLREKAREGVKVYLLYDHFGSFGTPRAFWRALRADGIKVRASHPFKLTSPANYRHRDHRKLIVVDGHTAFTGGLNIANEYRGKRIKLPFYIKKTEAWRDTGVLIKGPAAFSLLETFTRAWKLWGGIWEEVLGKGFLAKRGRGRTLPLYELPVNHPLDASGPYPVIPIFASSSKGRRRMRRILYYSLNHSKQEINLTTAYFTPSRRMLEALEMAVKKGVRVRLLVPGKSDVPAAHYAGRAFFTRLLRAGVEIYTYQGTMLHAKAYVFDGCWSIVGSANLDFLSLWTNDEGNVGLLDEGFGARMNAVFEEDLKQSEEIHLKQWHQRPLCVKLMERFFSLFRKRL